jgi:tetratricopeptide (TPR) repeat protein
LDSLEQLQLIRDAHSDPALLALATVDLTFPDLPNSERSALRSALEAAAIPHWCDADILAELTRDPDSPNSDQWMRLKQVPVVEPFPARGADAGNVHEANRLAIRKRLAETKRARFIELSSRAARVFEPDTRPTGRIEWIYHLLVADPDRGTAELEGLNRSWWGGAARHEDLAALSAALTELDTSQVLRGRSLVRARLIVAQRRADLAGAASLGELASQLLQAAEAIGDVRLSGDAYSLVGDVAQARGDLAGAEQAYSQDLAISKRLVALDPDNTSWQQDLAGVYSRVGGVAQARGDLAGAERAFGQALAVSERLAALDPDNTGWQRNLAVAYGRVGDGA